MSKKPRGAPTGNELDAAAKNPLPEAVDETAASSAAQELAGTPAPSGQVPPLPPLPPPTPHVPPTTLILGPPASDVAGDQFRLQRDHTEPTPSSDPRATTSEDDLWQDVTAIRSHIALLDDSLDLYGPSLKMIKSMHTTDDRLELLRSVKDQMVKDLRRMIGSSKAPPLRQRTADPAPPAPAPTTTAPRDSNDIVTRIRITKEVATMAGEYINNVSLPARTNVHAWGAFFGDLPSTAQNSIAHVCNFLGIEPLDDKAQTHVLHAMFKGTTTRIESAFPDAKPVIQDIHTRLYSIADPFLELKTLLTKQLRIAKGTNSFQADDTFLIAALDIFLSKIASSHGTTFTAAVQAFQTSVNLHPDASAILQTPMNKSPLARVFNNTIRNALDTSPIHGGGFYSIFTNFCLSSDAESHNLHQTLSLCHEFAKQASSSTPHRQGASAAARAATVTIPVATPARPRVIPHDLIQRKDMPAVVVSARVIRVLKHNSLLATSNSKSGTKFTVIAPGTNHDREATPPDTWKIGDIITGTMIYDDTHCYTAVQTPYTMSKWKLTKGEPATPAFATTSTLVPTTDPSPRTTTSAPRGKVTIKLTTGQQTTKSIFVDSALHFTATTSDQNNLHDVHPPSAGAAAVLLNGQHLLVQAVGTLRLVLENGTIINVPDAVVIPDLATDAILLGEGGLRAIAYTQGDRSGDVILHRDGRVSAGGTQIITLSPEEALAYTKITKEAAGVSSDPTPPTPTVQPVSTTTTPVQGPTHYLPYPAWMYFPMPPPPPWFRIPMYPMYPPYNQDTDPQAASERPDFHDNYPSLVQGDGSEAAPAATTTALKNDLTQEASEGAPAAPSGFESS
jgi:hypothetical protein